ncbi:hypothetical protein [Streptomyces sp. NPDC091215]|uniref:hypothetical protein n=1 Tax=Streptomyces sp. NPDC091215 TaxID=3155192 RepID=UPI0034302594
MVETVFELGPAGVVALHHFTSSLRFAQEGGSLREGAVDRFRAYIEAVVPILDSAEWVATMDSPTFHNEGPRP